MITQITSAKDNTVQSRFGSFANCYMRIFEKNILISNEMNEVGQTQFIPHTFIPPTHTRQINVDEHTGSLVRLHNELLLTTMLRSSAMLIWRMSTSVRANTPLSITALSHHHPLLNLVRAGKRLQQNQVIPYCARMQTTMDLRISKH